MENELLYDGKEYRVDWEKLEQQLADPQTTLMILCNPQIRQETSGIVRRWRGSGHYVSSMMSLLSRMKFTVI